MNKEIVIVSAARTPMGSFMGSLSTIPATKLGAVAIEGALNKINLDKSKVQEVFMGNVLQANLGQAPAKQASLGAGIPNTVPSTTINKVCASGMKSVIIGAQTIQTGDNDVVVAGGMESMSQAPYYLSTGRTGNKLGDQKLIDGLVKDGLINVYDQKHMGYCTELCAEEQNITREEQDQFAINSYTKSKNAWESGKYKEEVIPVNVPQRKKESIIISEDEEYKNVNFEKLKQLSTVFKENGTITAANASTINDGASALVLMSAEKAKELGIKPLAKIIGYSDAACAPEKFPMAPSLAIPLALKKAGLSIDKVDYFEVHEAFSAVSLITAKVLNINMDKLNVHGGAVALGHPLGSSGSRIIVTLLNILKQNKAKYGVAAACNGGGGASAIVLENLI